MSDRGGRADMVRLWLEKADGSLRVADTELEAGFASFAIGRLYYACFYALTALHLRDGKHFRRHSQVIGEFNRCYVNAGVVGREWADLVRQLFDNRQEGDYTALPDFEPEYVRERMAMARRFVAVIRGLLEGDGARGEDGR